MAIGQILTIPNNSAQLIVSQSHDSVPSLAMLNPNDGVCYIKLNGPASTTVASWDWKLPSQSYGLFPGPWQSLGVYYADQSGSGRAAEINVYDAQARLIVPEIHSIGRAVQVAGTTMDITEGSQPSNPSLGTVRLWADENGDLHLVDSSGNDETVLDTSNYGTLLITAGDVQGPIGSTVVRTTHLAFPGFSYAQNSSLVDKRWFAYSADGYTTFHAGDTGLLIANQANTVRLLTVDNGGAGVNIAVGGFSINNGNMTIQTPAGTTQGNIIYKSAGAIGAGNFNDGSHLNLQSADGQPPRIGFHRHGVIGMTLYEGNTNTEPLKAIGHDGVITEFITDIGTQKLINKNIVWQYDYNTTGVMTKYFCFYVLAVPGGVWTLPTSNSHAGEMIICKNWMGSDGTVQCPGGSVFGTVPGGVSSIVLHPGDSYTFMSDGGAGWMVI
jgi:hypothetical protein